MKNIFFVATIGILLVCNCKSKNYIVDDFVGISEDSIVNLYDNNMEISNDTFRIINVPNFNYFKRELYSKLDEVFDSIWYLRLATHSNCIIGCINQIEFINNTIIVRDQYQTRNICVFDMQGNFNRKIGESGSGPNEYVEPTDMYITSAAILVYDQWQHKMIKYQHNGMRIFEIQLPFICNQIAELTNGNYLYRGINSCNQHLPRIIDYQFWQTDSTFTIRNVGLYRKFNNYAQRWSNSDFFKSNGNLYYYDEITDTIHKFDSIGNVMPYYKFKFPSNHNKSVFLEKNIYKRNKEFNEGEYISVCDVKFIKNSIVYTLMTKGISTYVFQNLRNNMTHYFKRTEIENSNISRLLFMTPPLNTYNDYVVFSITPERILSMYEYAKNQKDYWQGAPQWVIDNDHKLIEGLNEEDNPILVFGRLKKEFYE